MEASQQLCGSQPLSVDILALHRPIPCCWHDGEVDAAYGEVARAATRSLGDCSRWPDSCSLADDIDQRLQAGLTWGGKDHRTNQCLGGDYGGSGGTSTHLRLHDVVLARRRPDR